MENSRGVQCDFPSKKLENSDRDVNRKYMEALRVSPHLWCKTLFPFWHNVEQVIEESRKQS